MECLSFDALGFGEVSGAFKRNFGFSLGVSDQAAPESLPANCFPAFNVGFCSSDSIEHLGNSSRRRCELLGQYIALRFLRAKVAPVGIGADAQHITNQSISTDYIGYIWNPKGETLPAADGTVRVPVLFKALYPAVF